MDLQCLVVRWLSLVLLCLFYIVECRVVISVAPGFICRLRLWSPIGCGLLFVFSVGHVVFPGWAFVCAMCMLWCPGVHLL